MVVLGYLQDRHTIDETASRKVKTVDKETETIIT